MVCYSYIYKEHKFHYFHIFSKKIKFKQIKFKFLKI